jgi:D-alanyl-D-alanine dipeptidase
MNNKIKTLMVICIIVNLMLVSFISIIWIQYVREKRIAEPAEVPVVYNNENNDFDDSDFVDIKKFIPEIDIELMYATEKNVAGKKLYKNSSAYLRYGTAVKLKNANDDLEKLGYHIKIWDAYRPISVQYDLWKKVPDTRYIADPKRGSVHNRGAAVDLTVINENGKELSMPTGFDGFSEKADRNYSDISSERAENARMLENIMVKNGFKSVYTEWWHFNDTDWEKYALVNNIESQKIKTVGYSLDVQGEGDKLGSEETEFELFRKWMLDKFKDFSIKQVFVKLQFGFSGITDI